MGYRINQRMIIYTPNPLGGLTGPLSTSLTTGAATFTTAFVARSPTVSATGTANLIAFQVSFAAPHTASAARFVAISLAFFFLTTFGTGTAVSGTTRAPPQAGHSPCIPACRASLSTAAWQQG